MTVKNTYLILSCKYFLRIPTKTTFISAESWKSYQLIRGHVVFLFTFDTYDVVRSSSIFLLPSKLYLTTYLVYRNKQIFRLFFGSFELFLCTFELISAALGPHSLSYSHAALGTEIVSTCPNPEIIHIWAIFFGSFELFSCSFALDSGSALQTFSLRQTDGELIKSRIIYPPTSPSAHKVGKNVS